jgi:hypothetical protein
MVPNFTVLRHARERRERDPKRFGYTIQVPGLRIDFAAEYAANSGLGHARPFRERSLSLQLFAGSHRLRQGSIPLNPGDMFPLSHMCIINDGLSQRRLARDA